MAQTPGDMPASGFCQYYLRRVFPWLNDRLASGPVLDRLQGEALAAAAGRVREIEFGGGASLRHYPPAVRRIVVEHGLSVEPGGSRQAWRRCVLKLYPVVADEAGVSGPHHIDLQPRAARVRMSRRGCSRSGHPESARQRQGRTVTLSLEERRWRIRSPV